MTILRRQERERLVLDLYYNQSKTYREISREARISPRDIRVILNKAIEEKTKEEQGIKQQDNNGAQKNQQQHLSLAAQAYKLFSDRKTPLEVAIALNLRESEATKFYREYWKLKQLHNLNIVYEELKGDIEPLIRLYKLSKAKGIGLKQVVNLLEIANNDLPGIQCRYERLKTEVNTLEFNKQQSHTALSYFNNQMEMKSKDLTSYRISCRRERREIENLCNEKARLEAIVTEFKSNNEEYLKIKEAAYREVKSVLTNNKLLLKFAAFSVIESLRSNPELCNFMMYYNSNNTAPSLMSGGQQQQHQQQSFNDSYTALILEESEKLYNKLMTEFTNMAIVAAAAMTASSLSSPSISNKQKIIHKSDNTYDEP